MSGSMKPAVYTKKDDGFRVICHLNAIYTSKNTDGMEGPMLKAIERYLLAQKNMDGDYIFDPYHIVIDNIKKGGRATKALCMHLEFTVNVKGKESLQPLFLRECLTKDGTLDVENYTYNTRIFDATFYKDNAIPYYNTHHAILEAFGTDMTIMRIDNFDELMHTLNTAEGVVSYEIDRDNSTNIARKIKAYIPVKGKIAGVYSSITKEKCGIEFKAWDVILFCIECDDGTLKAVYEIRFTDIFTDYRRVKEGKVFVNPHSIWIDDTKRVRCKSRTVIQPMLDALFIAISSRKMEKSKYVFRNEVRTKMTIKFGENRSFKPNPDMLFLAEPIEIVLGVNDIWRLPVNERRREPDIHLQAPSIMAFEGYDPDDLLSMPMTTEHLLHTVPTRDRIRAYEMLGVAHGPFDGIVRMRDALFVPEYTPKEAEHMQE
jgi:hypothetical protein